MKKVIDLTPEMENELRDILDAAEKYNEEGSESWILIANIHIKYFQRNQLKVALITGKNAERIGEIVNAVLIAEGMGDDEN